MPSGEIIWLQLCCMAKNRAWAVEMMGEAVSCSHQFAWILDDDHLAETYLDSKKKHLQQRTGGLYMLAFPMLLG